MVFALVKVAVLAATLLISNVAAYYPNCLEWKSPLPSGPGVEMVHANCQSKDPTSTYSVTECDITGRHNLVNGKSYWYPNEEHHEFAVELSSTASNPVAVRIFAQGGFISKCYKLEPHQPTCAILLEGIGPNSIRLWNE